MNTQFILIVLQVLIILLAVFALYKLRRIHHATFKINDAITSGTNTLYSQVQSYMDLVRLLKLDMPLPPLRGWAASPDFLLEIAKHALEAMPKVVLECSSGSSTITLARAMQINGAGHVYSLEHDSVYAEKTRKELGRQGLEKWATVVNAPLVDLTSLPGHRWYDLSAMPNLMSQVDMLVIDGPPEEICFMARYPAFCELKSTFSPCCAIFLDDYSRNQEKQSVNKWLSEDSAWSVESLSCEKGCAKLTKHPKNI